MRDKLKQVVFTAIARELAGFVWAIACIRIGSLPRRRLRKSGCADNALADDTAVQVLSGMHRGGREPVQGQASTIALELDFRLKTEAGPRRTMVLR